MTATPVQKRARAACAGQIELFEAATKRRHKRARQLCRGCPIFEECTGDVEEQLAEKMLVHGTWAGRLFVKGRERIVP